VEGAVRGNGPRDQVPGREKYGKAGKKSKASGGAKHTAHVHEKLHKG